MSKTKIMNILYVLGDVWWKPCGISNSTKLNAQYISKYHNVNILCEGYSKKYNEKNYKVLSSNVYGLKNFISSLVGILKAFLWADIIHYQSLSRTQRMLTVLSIVFPKKQIVEFHGTDIWYSSIKNKYMKILLNKADKIIVLSHGHKHELVRRFTMIKEDKITVIPYAYAESKELSERPFVTLKQQKSTIRIVLPKGFRYLREDEYYAKNLRKILSKGYLVSGQEYLVEAMRILRDRNIQVELFFLGDGEKRELEKLVEQYKLKSQIHFLGNVSQKVVYNYYKTCDILVCPSILESWCNIQIEALYAGLPVIASRTAGTIEQLTYNFSGFNSVEIGDVESIVNIIENIADYPFSQEQYKENLNILSKNLNIDVIGKRHMKNYTELKGIS